MSTFAELELAQRLYGQAADSYFKVNTIDAETLRSQFQTVRRCLADVIQEKEYQQQELQAARLSITAEYRHFLERKQNIEQQFIHAFVKLIRDQDVITPFKTGQEVEFIHFENLINILVERLQSVFDLPYQRQRLPLLQDCQYAANLLLQATKDNRKKAITNLLVQLFNEQAKLPNQITTKKRTTISRLARQCQECAHTLNLTALFATAEDLQLQIKNSQCSFRHSLRHWQESFEQPEIQPLSETIDLPLELAQFENAVLAVWRDIDERHTIINQQLDRLQQLQQMPSMEPVSGVLDLLQQIFFYLRDHIAPHRTDPARKTQVQRLFSMINEHYDQRSLPPFDFGLFNKALRALCQEIQPHQPKFKTGSALYKKLNRWLQQPNNTMMLDFNGAHAQLSISYEDCIAAEAEFERQDILLEQDQTVLENQVRTLKLVTETPACFCKQYLLELQQCDFDSFNLSSEQETVLQRLKNTAKTALLATTLDNSQLIDHLAKLSIEGDKVDYTISTLAELNKSALYQNYYWLFEIWSTLAKHAQSRISKRKQHGCNDIFNAFAGILNKHQNICTLEKALQQFLEDIENYTASARRTRMALSISVSQAIINSRKATQLIRAQMLTQSLEQKTKIIDTFNHIPELQQALTSSNLISLFGEHAHHIFWTLLNHATSNHDHVEFINHDDLYVGHLSHHLLDIVDIDNLAGKELSAIDINTLVRYRNQLKIALLAHSKENTFHLINNIDVKKIETYLPQVHWLIDHLIEEHIRNIRLVFSNDEKIELLLQRISLYHPDKAELINKLRIDAIQKAIVVAAAQPYPFVILQKIINSDLFAQIELDKNPEHGKKLAHTLLKNHPQNPELFLDLCQVMNLSDNIKDDIIELFFSEIDSNLHQQHALKLGYHQYFFDKIVTTLEPQDKNIPLNLTQHDVIIENVESYIRACQYDSKVLQKLIAFFDNHYLECSMPLATQFQDYYKKLGLQLHHPLQRRCQQMVETFTSNFIDNFQASNPHLGDHNEAIDNYINLIHDNFGSQEKDISDSTSLEHEIIALGHSVGLGEVLPNIAISTTDETEEPSISHKLTVSFITLALLKQALFLMQKQLEKKKKPETSYNAFKEYYNALLHKNEPI